MNHTERLLKVIPGGAHTYSRGPDQFPQNAPEILERGKGVLVYDAQGRDYLDYGMGLRSVIVGYGEERINRAAIRQIETGNTLTRASLIELEAAERLVDMIDGAEMVKFAKNGSNATSAAVKIARAHTGRDLVARCAQHPFFSFDDWFIGSTCVPRGVPQNIARQTKLFDYNDIGSLERLIARYPDQVACVIMEPAVDGHPGPSRDVAGETFLHDVERLCRKQGLVFILDEMITGFRWHLKGAQHYYGVRPDLSTFGKAMANGFSVAAVAGRRDLMQLGSIEAGGQERVFLLSSTHGAEMAPLGAFVETMAFMAEHRVVEKNRRFGERLIGLINEAAARHGLGRHLKAAGVACSPHFTTLDRAGKPCLGLRTVFLQELLRRGVMMPWIAIAYRHGEAELARTGEALEAALPILRQALEDGVETVLEGPAIKPVFRRYN